MEMGNVRESSETNKIDTRCMIWRYEIIQNKQI